MQLIDSQLWLSATDLSNHIACAHLTRLSHDAAISHERFERFDPLLALLRERGVALEEAHLARLRAEGLRIERGEVDLEHRMAEGVDVIYQASLGGARWHGRADFLRRVERPGRWPWSYEVQEVKLASDTRAGAVLQLCAYSDLLAPLQGVEPEHMHVVRPDGHDAFRYVEYAAIYRALKSDLERATQSAAPSYPEPTAHCDTCAWRERCAAQRRLDDHLSLVADLGRPHQRELAALEIRTRKRLASTPPPWAHKPRYGTPRTYDRLAQQARLQVAAEDTPVPPYELLRTEPERGLARLPAPSPGDIFLDLEGDPFIGANGREYLFGWLTADAGHQAYWALDDEAERNALARLFALIDARWQRHPDMHIYHFAAYEPTALKRLVGRYGIGRDLLDRLLRGQRMIDLYSITKQTARIGVESYGLKSLERVIGYARPAAIAETADHVRAVRLALQHAREVPAAWRVATEIYNRGDCEATQHLRAWLEARRDEVDALARPVLSDGQPTHPPSVQQTEAAALATRLLAELPADRASRSALQQASWLLGNAMEWYRREAGVVWWELFRLADTTHDERLDELHALSGLEHIARLPGKTAKTPIDRYRFPDQDATLELDNDLHVDAKLTVGSLAALDRDACTIDIKKTGKTIDLHPLSVFAHSYVAPGAKQDALLALGREVAETGWPASSAPSLARDLLLGEPLRGIGATLARRVPGESHTDCAVRLALALRQGILPIQGPPGTGKTTTAARVIIGLVRAGKKIGIAANSHAVIENLIAKVAELASEQRIALRAARKDDAKARSRVEVIADAKDAAARMPTLDVLGATAWQWARDDMREAVDVLVIDEASQVSLADALAMCGAARNLIVVGDPQQLEQPVQGTHPDGIAVSVLQHLIGDRAVIEPERGLFLDETHRLHPALAQFTSEQFYASALTTHPSLARRQLTAGPLSAAGSYWLPIAHQGNRNHSRQEAQAVAQLVVECLAHGHWTPAATPSLDGDRTRNVTARTITAHDILVVAPYNAHVAEVRRALALRGLGEVRVGTVDKFQGQEAAIAIYTMATSRPEDAPRGLDFLYSRHRFNVATSRASCATVVVASPDLLRPRCTTPHHLHLANALARYVELAQPLPSPTAAE